MLASLLFPKWRWLRKLPMPWTFRSTTWWVLVKDKKMAYRIEPLERISEEDRQTILKVMDSLLKEAQTASLDKKLR